MNKLLLLLLSLLLLLLLLEHENLPDYPKHTTFSEYEAYKH